MAVIQKYYPQYSDGVEEGYISDTIYNYVDNKICQALTGTKTANTVVGENGPIPFGYSICRGTPGDSVDYGRGDDSANGQFTKVGVERKAIGLVKGPVTASGTTVVVDGLSHRVYAGDIFLIKTGAAANKVWEKILVTGITASETEGEFSFTVSRGVGTTNGGAIADNAEVFLLDGGQINMVGVAILDPRLPAVTLHGPMENKIPHGQIVNCLWFGDVNVRTFTAVNPGDPVSVWVGKGNSDINHATHKIGDRTDNSNIVGMSYGSFSNEAPDVDIIRVPNAEWREKTSAGKIGKIRIAFPGN